MKFLLLGCGALATAAAASGNMNGEYIIQSGARQGVEYNDDYASRGQEYFDVWAPEIATQYAQVFWTSQGVLPLPQEIVDRFAGKVIAITGYEQDQVMVTPTGQPGVNPDKDVSVPINWAYNHHYMAWMAGAAAEIVEVPADGPADPIAHGAPTKVIARPKAGVQATDASVPVSQMFSEGNGGESRKSYHGYPTGYAQLVQSPKTWTITPMQIDTRNRDCGITPDSVTNCTRFVPGPEPKQARYAFGTPEGTNYSGVLECPCNGNFGGDPSLYGKDTLTKQITTGYASTTSQCASAATIATAGACFDAAATYLGVDTVISNVSVTDKNVPAGCSVARDPKTAAVTATFNAATSTEACSSGSHQVGETHFAESGVTLHLDLLANSSTVSFKHSEKGKYCSKNHDGVLGTFKMTSTDVTDAQQQLAKCEAFCTTAASCAACSVDCPGISRKECQWVAIEECGSEMSWGGIIPGDISYKQSSGNVTITMSGPASAWFAVGFNAQNMHDQPYTLIVNSTGVLEQKLGTCGSEADHCPGTDLTPSVDVVSNDVDGDTRTVVMTRSFSGITGDHYTFNAAVPTIPMISAVGSSQQFAYHKAHSVGAVSVFDADGSPLCVCDSGSSGKMCEHDGTGCETFVKDCVPETEGGDLLQQKNPTCNSMQYAGGLRCCGHERIMLDYDQTCDNCDELLRYHMKFRFWFQEYTPANDTHNATHYNLDRFYYTTEERAGEYDIPPAFAKPGIPIPGYPNWPLNTPTPGTHCNGTCPDGPDCECYHEITYRWESPDMRLVYAGGHCHAPSCISLELFRNDTGELELLCGQYPVYGQGNVSHDKFDEAGYIIVPPCLWGDEGELEPSVLLPKGTPLVSIKRNRNTHLGHYGEMASWQMRGTSF